MNDKIMPSDSSKEVVGPSGGEEVLNTETPRDESVQASAPVPPAAVKETVIAMMRTVFDPEIPVNIYDLGMVYNVDVDENGVTLVRMTLTSPMCPVAGSLPGEVQAKVASVAGVSSAKVDLVWDPPWHPDMMTEAAKLTLNMM